MRANRGGARYSAWGTHLFLSPSPRGAWPHLALWTELSSDGCWVRRPRPWFPVRKDVDGWMLGKSPSAATGFWGKLAGNVMGLGWGLRGRSHDAGFV